jgi:hypothetical protein
MGGRRAGANSMIRSEAILLIANEYGKNFSKETPLANEKEALVNMQSILWRLQDDRRASLLTKNELKKDAIEIGALALRILIDIC